MFCIQLLVKINVASCFAFNEVKELAEIGVDVQTDDVLLNLVSKVEQKMNGDKPWRAGREKDSVLLGMLIESTTMPMVVHGT